MYLDADGGGNSFVEICYVGTPESLDAFTLYTNGNLLV